MITDYFLLRRTRLDVDSLYRRGGIYEYKNGVNWKAVGALASGIALALSGLVVPVLRPLYDYSWFVGFAVAASVYLILNRSDQGRKTRIAGAPAAVN